MTARARTVLITGCSSGIGRATAAHLAGRGHRVYATARRPESLADLEKRGCRTLQLDVTDGASIAVAVTTIEDDEGAVDVLVNNAGYGLHGAFEEASIEEVRRQFETNLFGPILLAQKVLPRMREQKWGRIVNVSSMGGRLAFPGGAFYHGTKHALEAVSDVMRFELKPFGIDVVVIEPGLIKTGFGEAATAEMGDEDEGPYASFNRSLRNTLESAYEGPMSRAATGPEAVAGAIAKAIERRHPRSRYVVPAATRALLVVRRIAPDRVWDLMLRAQYQPPSPSGGSPTRE